MAKRKSSKRGRSRRPSSQRPPGEPTAGPTVESGSSSVAAPERPASARAPSEAPRTRDRSRGTEQGRDERPQAPWHPVPLSELLILVGGIGVVVAWKRGAEGGPALLIASIAAVAIGTVEVTLREHLGGYRSHAVLLALIPVVVLHSAVLLVAGAFTSVPRWVNIPLLAIDIVIFSVLFKLLRLRYLDARRERRFAR